MINISLNGEQIMTEAHNILTLIQSKNLKPDTVVVEKNLEITKREEWDKLSIKDGDKIEIIRFMGGGSGDDPLIIGSKVFHSRLFTGTGKFASPELIAPMLQASESEMITVALRRVDFSAGDRNILEYIPQNITLLPNTSGARNAAEAVRIAKIAREAGCGNFVKIEVITDIEYLMPDGEETLKAAEILAKDGFTVLPYIQADPILCKKLEDAGAAAVMPMGAPIGSNMGLQTRPLLEMIIEKSELPVVVDAGIGRPSQAADAMEMGADAVLVNTAISTAGNPAKMGRAFSMAVKAGREAFLAEGREAHAYAEASSPLTGFLRLEDQ